MISIIHTSIKENGGFPKVIRVGSCLPETPSRADLAVLQDKIGNVVEIQSGIMVDALRQIAASRNVDLIEYVKRLCNRLGAVEEKEEN